MVHAASALLFIVVSLSVAAPSLANDAFDIQMDRRSSDGYVHEEPVDLFSSLNKLIGLPPGILDLNRTTTITSIQRM